MSKPISITSISVPIVLVLALLVVVGSSGYAVSIFIMSRSVATTEHQAIESRMEKDHKAMNVHLEKIIAAVVLENSKTYLESKIDIKKDAMHLMALEGINTDDERNRYDLLAHSVLKMTLALGQLK